MCRTNSGACVCGSRPGAANAAGDSSRSAACCAAPHGLRRCARRSALRILMASIVRWSRDVVTARRKFCNAFVSPTFALANWNAFLTDRSWMAVVVAEFRCSALHDRGCLHAPLTPLTAPRSCATPLAPSRKNHNAIAEADGAERSPSVTNT
ncbi:hypothetical protein EVAR_16729_1 [Eumeta japonica]|uniref:Uncharacterized protein n=1 Tax=Eumeta variegata TaxID=151549 RepID=A0A4C1V4I0_EUMVA|nr:hypothetical protein EVAR_16729_1 [Eumeta japonica]